MTPDELETFAYLMTTLGRCIAERRALITIGQGAGIPDLEARLRSLRESDEYKLTVLQYQLAAKQLQVDDTAQALARLLQQLDEGKPQN